MNGSPFLINCLLNFSYNIQCLIDTGYLCFAAFSEELVLKNKLPRIRIPKTNLYLAKNDGMERKINEITFADFDINGSRERVNGYVIPNLAYDVILGKPWMEHNNVTYLSRKRMIRFSSKKKKDSS